MNQVVYQWNQSRRMVYALSDILKVLCFIAFCSSGLAFSSDTPVLSSKAVSTAMTAKGSIAGSDETAIRSAVTSLEGLLHEASFRRLEPQMQVQILLLLVKGYSKLGQYREQESLLESYAKKPELHRFHIHLKAALARSFIQQHRFAEADAILDKIVSSSCAHMPLEEKTEITSLLTYRDEYIYSLLRQADRTAENGNFAESLEMYSSLSTVITSPWTLFQSSPSEKQLFQEKFLLQMSELLFCLGQYQKGITMLEEEPFAPSGSLEAETIFSRRLFLLALLQHAQGNSSKAEASWREYVQSSHHNPVIPDLTSSSPGAVGESETILFWKATNALKKLSKEDLSNIITLIGRQKKPSPALVHVLKAYAFYLDQDIVAAIDETERALARSETSHQPWKEAAFLLRADCSFQRALLLFSAGRKEESISIAKQALSNDMPQRGLLRVSALHLFLWMSTGEAEQKEQALSCFKKAPKCPDLSPLQELLQQILFEETTRTLPSSLTAHDHYFSLILKERGFFAFEDSKDSVFDDPSSVISLYCQALNLFSRARTDDHFSEEATQSLQKLIDHPGLVDARPQFLHCLAELSIQNNQISTACEYIDQLITKYPSYQKLPQAALSCFFACQNVPSLQSRRSSLSTYLLSIKPLDISALTLILALHEERVGTTKSIKGSDQGYEKEQITPRATPLEESALTLFDAALQSRDDGRAFLAEAAKSKEPRVIADKIRLFMKAFSEARNDAIETLGSCTDAKTQSFLWGFILAIDVEQIEAIEKYVPTDFAFNELPLMLDEAGSRLSQDMNVFHATVPLHMINEAFLSSCQTLIQTSVIYAETFRRDLSKALSAAKNISDPSSPQVLRSLVYLARVLRESGRTTDEIALLSPIKERRLVGCGDLPLEIAIEKSLYLRELHKTDKAMALLAWVINGPYASSLRVKAMVLRADLYLSLFRKDLAIRQLESVAAKGGEWGAVAERKLRELYGTN